MGCVIDHLSSYCRVRVLQDFSDRRGTRIRAGETGVIRQMDLTWSTQEIEIEWERDGRIEKMFFALAAKEGPRNGHMRDFFAVEGMAPWPKPPAPPRLRSAPAPLPPEMMKATAGGYGDGLARVHALAAGRHFAVADEHVRALLKGRDDHGGLLQQVAGDLGDIAVAYADDDPVYLWAREWATNLWYSWGANATSGGEGAARLSVIESAIEGLNRRSGRDR